jgi:hypothetical protein
MQLHEGMNECGDDVYTSGLTTEQRASCAFVILHITVFIMNFLIAFYTLGLFALARGAYIRQSIREQYLSNKMDSMIFLIKHLPLQAKPQNPAVCASVLCGCWIFQ